MGKLSEILQLSAKRAADLKLPYAGAVTPKEAWELWQGLPETRLVDVRTQAEWDYVGRIPGAIQIEWQTYPGNQRNPNFLAQLKHQVDPESLVLFICRSGGRSGAAAATAAAAGFTNCHNVLEGFEGDRDAFGRRNTVGGWRAAGLPWEQS
ncbi:MAG: hypothetical protein AMXMBFR6_00020 [Betaproteobacteria bacterium]